MIIVKKFNFGDYFQKIIMDNQKVKDCTCNCKWGLNNQKAYKEGKTICNHVVNAIRHLNLRLKKYGIK